MARMPRFDGKFVIVTGAAGALGGGLCRAFADAGATVTGLDRVTPGADRALDGVRYVAVDLADDAAVGAAFDEAPLPWAVVHTVGGFSPAAPLAELDVEDLNRQLTLNLTTSALVVKHALRLLQPQGTGRIVLTASRAAFQTTKVAFSYSVSKLGVVHLVEMAGAEVAGSGVTVNAVSPSIIDTPANRRAMPDSNHDAWPSVAELAHAYLFLASEEAGRVNATITSV
jgi:NAD(P)-dependent dehydrogenase (short-subunit alcohol dehydrogenase family)